MLEAVADELPGPMQALVESGALLRARIEDVFGQAIDRADNMHLEIASPGVGEFLIGDTPAVAIRFDRPGIGPREGIALDDAIAVVLPLGPKHIASFGM